MVLPAESNVLCKTLVGRDAYLEQFADILGAAAGREGRVIAISGEAGIGKSRLTAELRRIAETQRPPFSVARGNCFEFDSSTPFAPIVDMLRGCLTNKPPEEVARCAATDGAELLRILPELGPLLPGVEPATARDPEQDKRRLLVAISNTLVRLSSSAPLLIVLEDLHWSDETSLEALLQFARRTATEPIVLVLTFRSDEVHPPLRRLLAGLDRERIVTDWRLSHLSAAQVAAMIASIFGDESAARTDAIARIHGLTEGNPFFIEELLKSLEASGDSLSGQQLSRTLEGGVTIPRSVQAAVQERTSRLGEQARRVIELAAVSGQRFDFALLEQLSELSEAELLDVMKELIAAQLVAEESADHFVFRHALTQQAIYSELLARERRALHGRIGQAIQAVYTNSIDSHVEELAHHFHRAEMWDEAYYYCRRAGEHALSLHSAEAAREHLTRAIEAGGNLGVDIPASVYRMRGQAHEALGDFAAARTDFERSFELAQAASDGHAEWQALIDLGFLWAGRDYERAGSYFRHATDLSEMLNDDRLRARSLNRLGNWLVNVGRCEEGIALHEQALELMEQMNDDAGRVETLDLLGMANGLYGNQPESVRRYRQVIEHFRGASDQTALATTLAGICAWFSPILSEATHVEEGDPHEAFELSEQGVIRSAQTGRVSTEMFARMSAAQVYITYGRFDQALGHLNPLLQLASDARHQQWLAAGQLELGQVALFTHDVANAVRHLTDALELAGKLGSAWWIGNTAAYLSRALLMQSRYDEARRVLQRGWPDGEAPKTLGHRRVELARAELALAEGKPAEGLSRAEALIATAPGAMPSSRMPVLRHVQGDALAALRREDDALAVLLQARDDAHALKTSTILWPIERSLGRLYQQMKRGEEAEGHFATARSIIDEIAGQNADEGLRERFRAGSLATLPAPRRITPNQAAKAQYDGLTARERDVAALIAQGKSNRDIAEALVLGERTIETHVGNILGKLRFSSRAQIAAWAVQKKLIHDA
jgi:DNA-binding CsgD family transcriptional regulator